MIKTTKDGRTILTGRHYRMFRCRVIQAALLRCQRCGRGIDLDTMHVHHTRGRGMGGGKRDDTLQACKALCGDCHRKEHNQ